MSDGAALARTADRFVDGAEDSVAIPSRTEADDLTLLAGRCDRARRSDRELDASIALALFPSMRSLRPLSTGVWAHPDGSRVRALRYSSSSVAAMTLVPSGHWVEYSVEIVGQIEIHGPDGAEPAGWGWNDHFPLAAAAAALRARAALARSTNRDERSADAPPGDTRSPRALLAKHQAQIGFDRPGPTPPPAQAGSFDPVLTVWSAFLAVWVAFFGLFWFFSPRNEASALVAAAALLFGLLAFGAPMVMERRASHIRPSAATARAPVGALRAWAAVVQVVLVPVGLVAALAIFMLLSI